MRLSEVLKKLDTADGVVQEFSQILQGPDSKIVTVYISLKDEESLKVVIESPHKNRSSTPDLYLEDCCPEIKSLIKKGEIDSIVRGEVEGFFYHNAKDEIEAILAEKLPYDTQVIIAVRSDGAGLLQTLCKAAARLN